MILLLNINITYSNAIIKYFNIILSIYRLVIIIKLIILTPYKKIIYDNLPVLLAIFSFTIYCTGYKAFNQNF